MSRDQAPAVGARDGYEVGRLLRKLARESALDQPQRAAYRGERRAQLVADGRNELVLHAVELLALGVVAHHGGKLARATEPHFAHQQFHRKRLTAAAPALDGILAAAHHRRFLAREIAGKEQIERLAMGLGDQGVDMAPDDLLGGVAKNPLGRGVQGLDRAIGIDRDDAVQDRFEDGVQPLLALLGCARRPFPLGDVGVHRKNGAARGLVVGRLEPAPSGI